MAEFDFNKVQVTKSEKVPALTRSRTSAPNPLSNQYAESVKAKGKDGLGAWLNIPMPGKEETTIVEKDGKQTSKLTYGPTVKKAMNYLRQAAAAMGLGVSFRVETPNAVNKLAEGTVKLHFQSKPKRGDVS
jgi:hypothetical protein